MSSKEIREGIIEEIQRWESSVPYVQADAIIEYLHSQGVVIESKDEAIYHHGYFPKIEPLIEVTRQLTIS